MNIIGLEQHHVILVRHQPEWLTLCGVEVKRLQELIGDLVADIQHVGSTAVPDLPAKPILDIAIAVQNEAAIPAIAACLTNAGYIDGGDAGRDGGYLLVKECEPGVRTIHIHIVDLGDGQWRDYIRFRDILRNDERARKDYAALKESLAMCYADDRKAYTASKNDFIQGVLRGRATE